MKLRYFSQRQHSCRFRIVIFKFVQKSPTYVSVHSCRGPCNNTSIFTSTSPNTLPQASIFPKLPNLPGSFQLFDR